MANLNSIIDVSLRNSVEPVGRAAVVVEIVTIVAGVVEAVAGEVAALLPVVDDRLSHLRDDLLGRPESLQDKVSRVKAALIESY